MKQFRTKYCIMLRERRHHRRRQCAIPEPRLVTDNNLDNGPVGQNKGWVVGDSFLVIGGFFQFSEYR